MNPIAYILSGMIVQRGDMRIVSVRFVNKLKILRVITLCFQLVHRRREVFDVIASEGVKLNIWAENSLLARCM